MENQTNVFIGGLHSDFNEQNQPPNTYRQANNWVRNLDGSLSNEKGTSNPIIGLPARKVWGAASVEDEIVLFIGGDATNESEIGYVRNNAYYRILTRNDLKFNQKVNARIKVNYKNDRIVYFVDGVNEDRCLVYNPDNASPTDNSADLSLQLTSKQPRVKLVSVNDNGNLPTGVYQFSCRLVTSSGNKTSASLLSNPINVSNEQGSTSFSVDGAVPQSPGFKSISIEIDNLDDKFDFVEIIATTYQGITNVPKTNVIGLKPITGTSVSFVYDSIDQNQEELTLDELTVEPVIYKTSKLIELKDNHLFRANVTVSKQSVDFQQVANNAIVKYTIKELSYGETIVIDPVTAKENTGSSTYIPYKDPIISANLRGYQRGEVYSFALVPKYKDGSYGWAHHIPCNTVFDSITKTLDAFTSTLDYPAGYGYPVGKVKHFKMPTLDQEPVYNGTNIRVLGLTITVDLATYLTPAQLDLIDGVVVVRQRRTERDKSIVTQGIAQNLVATGGAQNLLMVSPFHGKPNYIYGTADLWANYKRNYVAFYSPDTTIVQDSMMAATSIVPVAVASGVGYILGEKREGDRKDKYAHTFIDFKNYTYASRPAVTINRDTIQYMGIEQGDFRTSANNITTGERFSTKESNGYLFFKIDGNLSVFKNESTSDVVDGTIEISYDEVANATDRIIVQKDGLQKNQDESGRMFDASRLIYNLVASKPSQYGEVLSAEYIIENERQFDLTYTSQIDGSVLPTYTIECFGGDTFINKVAMMSTTAEIQDGTLKDSFGLRFRTLNYVMLESTLNTAMRHYIGSGDNMTVPYFPKYGSLWKETGNGLLNIDPKMGHSRGYNKQYSFDNGLKKFFSKSLLEPEEQTQLTNRVIYSEVSIEGEQYDANRVFLPNNYHDIPRHKGDITDMFSLANILYIHTPQTLYRTFTNEQTAIISSSGQVATGNGGLFPRPSVEMTTVDGGYGGSKGQTGCNTPYGRMWLDQIQKKIFLLGESMTDISMNSISIYLGANINPNTNYSSVYDYANSRWILSGNFTISYSPELKSFTSTHTYWPHLMFSVGRRLFMCKDTLLHEHNIGVPGRYFNNLYASDIIIVSNDNPLITKSFDNFFIQSTKCLSSLKVSGDDRESITNNLRYINTFDYELIDGELLVKYKNNQYQMALPRTTDGTRFKYKWIRALFTYDNTNELNLKYITTLYRPVAR